MFTPAATAARMARLPEWANVPSPMFCTRCRCVDERRHADPLRALAAHLGQPGDLAPTCSSGISSTMAWQPIPPPTSVPGATLVEELCGQPEQKYGVRGASGSMTRSRGRPAARSGTPARLEVAGDSPSATASASSSPNGGEQRASRPGPACRRRRARPAIP